MKSKVSSKNLASTALPSRRYNFLTFIVLSALVLVGCSGEKLEPKFTVTEAQKAFQAKCLKDFNMHVRTRQVGSTFWIYLPIKDPIFDYEVQKPKPPGSQPSPNKFVVNFTDGKYKNGLFTFEYDIVEKKKTKDEDYGFSSSYTDSYIKNQNNLFTAVYEIFFNTKPKGDEVLPQFFVIVITDIKKGIETRATFYLDDFVRFMSGAIPYDEYVKRFLSDRKGNPAMIGDETGSHLRYSSITMSEFLTRQIVNRISFKFQYSDFPPGESYDNTIIGIVADTLRYYKFNDYTNIRLNNIRLSKKYLFDKSQLVNFGEDKPKENQGRLIHIRFKDGKPEFEEQPSDQTTSNAQEPDH